MEKVKVKYCKKCRSYRECTYLGKEPRTSDEIRGKIEEAVFSFGVWPLMDLACGTDKRPKFWKCKECENIFKE